MWRSRMEGWKKDRARELRRNLTPPEELLWERLRRKRLGVKFRRQAPIGGYIADFWCPKLKLVVEVDGSCHRKRRERDRARDKQLSRAGVQTVRIPAWRVLEEPDEVVAELAALIEAKGGGNSVSPSHSPFPG